MNCRDIEPLLLAERDGVLNTVQHTSLEQHVAACPACRQMRDRLAGAMSALQTHAANVPLPDPDAEWQTLRARLKVAEARPHRKRSLAPVFWFGAPLATAAAVALAFFINSPTTPNRDEFAQVADAASAEFVEAGDADASTMVYVDKESGWLVVWATDSESGHSI